MSESGKVNVRVGKGDMGDFSEFCLIRDIREEVCRRRNKCVALGRVFHVCGGSETPLQDHDCVPSMKKNDYLRVKFASYLFSFGIGKEHEEMSVKLNKTATVLDAKLLIAKRHAVALDKIHIKRDNNELSDKDKLKSGHLFLEVSGHLIGNIGNNKWTIVPRDVTFMEIAHRKKLRRDGRVVNRPRGFRTFKRENDESITYAVEDKIGDSVEDGCKIRKCAGYEFSDSSVDVIFQCKGQNDRDMKFRGDEKIGFMRTCFCVQNNIPLDYVTLRVSGTPVDMGAPITSIKENPIKVEVVCRDIRVFLEKGDQMTKFEIGLFSRIWDLKQLCVKRTDKYARQISFCDKILDDQMTLSMACFYDQAVFIIKKDYRMIVTFQDQDGHVSRRVCHRDDSFDKIASVWPGGKTAVFSNGDREYHEEQLKDVVTDPSYRIDVTVGEAPDPVLSFNYAGSGTKTLSVSQSEKVYEMVSRIRGEFQISDDQKVSLKYAGRLLRNSASVFEKWQDKKETFEIVVEKRTGARLEVKYDFIRGTSTRAGLFVSMWGDDSVYDLRAAIAKTNEVKADGTELRAAVLKIHNPKKDKRCDDQRKVAEVYEEGEVMHVKHVTVAIKVKILGETREFEIAESGTVLDLRQEVSKRLDKCVEHLICLGKKGDELINKDTEYEISYMPSVIFTIHGRRLEKNVDWNRPLRDIVKDMCNNEGEPLNDNFSVRTNGSSVTDKSLSGLGFDCLGHEFQITDSSDDIPVVPETAAPKAPSEDVVRDLYDFTEQLPKKCTVTVPMDILFSDLEVKLREKRPEILCSIEFATLDDDSELVSVIPKCDALNTIPADVFIAFIRPEDAAYVGCDVEGEDDRDVVGTTASIGTTATATTMSLIMTVSPETPEPAAATMRTFKFNVDTVDLLDLEIQLPPGATVKNAKEELSLCVKNKSGQQFAPEYFSLIWNDSPMRDTLILDRMRINGRTITVFIKDTRDILLFTANG